MAPERAIMLSFVSRGTHRSPAQGSAPELASGLEPHLLLARPRLRVASPRATGSAFPTTTDAKQAHELPAPPEQIGRRRDDREDDEQSLDEE